LNFLIFQKHLQLLVKKLACDLSAEFYKFPSLFNSAVQINQLLVNVYFVNSEGTEVKSQIPFIKLTFHAGVFDEFGSAINDGMQYYAKDIHGLPAVKQIRADIQSLAHYLLSIEKAPHFDENYSGPVLLVGQPSMRSYMKALFNSENSLIAFREDLVSAGQSQLYYSRNRNALETKLGKMIAPKTFTIKDVPSAQIFQNISLLGGYKIDAEGVVVPDTLILVENGVLRNLMGSRTPTKNVPNSNGHRRFNISQGGTTEQVAPGNIFISSTEGQSMESLKQKLIDQAKELGLDYAFIIRPIIESDAMVPEEIIKINVENGNEERVRAIYQPDMGNVSFRDLANCSKKVKAFNLLYNGNYMDAMNSARMSSSGSIAGIPMSIVSPEAVLITKGKITTDKKQISGNKPEVPNPLEEMPKK